MPNDDDDITDLAILGLMLSQNSNTRRPPRSRRPSRRSSRRSSRGGKGGESKNSDRADERREELRAQAREELERAGKIIEEYQKLDIWVRDVEILRRKAMTLKNLNPDKFENIRELIEELSDQSSRVERLLLEKRQRLQQVKSRGQRTFAKPEDYEVAQNTPLPDDSDNEEKALPRLSSGRVPPPRKQLTTNSQIRLFYDRSTKAIRKTTTKDEDVKKIIKKAEEFKRETQDVELLFLLTSLTRSASNRLTGKKKQYTIENRTPTDAYKDKFIKNMIKATNDNDTYDKGRMSDWDRDSTLSNKSLDVVEDAEDPTGVYDTTRRRIEPATPRGSDYGSNLSRRGSSASSRRDSSASSRRSSGQKLENFWQSDTSSVTSSSRRSSGSSYFSAPGFSEDEGEEKSNALREELENIKQLIEKITRELQGVRALYEITEMDNEILRMRDKLYFMNRTITKRLAKRLGETTKRELQEIIMNLQTKLEDLFSKAVDKRLEIEKKEISLRF